MYYILHGEDEFSRSEELARMRRLLAEGDPGMAELNTTILDGNSVTLAELRHTCDTLPFLSDRRMVIVHGLLQRLRPRSRGDDRDKPAEEEPGWRRQYVEGLTGYLPNLPPSTRLLFVESIDLPPSHPILRFAQSETQSKLAHVRAFKRPKDRDLPGWTMRRAKAAGGSVSQEAAERLAMLIGDNLRALDQEIEKLLVYAAGRQVTARDVGLLVSRARETSVFDLVDHLGHRRTGLALTLLHRMLDDGEEPLYLLAMLARQVRILLQVGELVGQGLHPPEIAGRLELHPYVVEKGVAQARHFSLEQLEDAHQRVVATDLAIKTGDVEPALALDLLVLALSKDLAA